MYHLDSLSATSSIKRRGKGGPLEHKRRIGDSIVFQRHAVTGHAEQWIKKRIRGRRSKSRLTGEWISVDKQLWSARHSQIAYVVIDGAEWWTIAVALPNGCLTTSTLELLDKWSLTIAAHGEASSYPSWVLRTVGGGVTAAGALGQPLRAS